MSSIGKARKGSKGDGLQYATAPDGTRYVKPKGIRREGPARPKGKMVVVGYFAPGKPFEIEQRQLASGMEWRMADWLKIARQKFPPAKGRRKLLKANALTSDIMKAVNKEIVQSRHQVKPFVDHLYDVAGNLSRNHRDVPGWEVMQAASFWKWIRYVVRYKEDEMGMQDILTPAAVLARRVADCKGLTILFSSLLFQAGIPHEVAYSSKEKDGDYKHVFVVVNFPKPDGTVEKVPMDCCMDLPGEWPTGHMRFKYYNVNEMTSLYSISGPANGAIMSLPADLGSMTDVELGLHIAKAQRLAKMGRAVAVAGIGRLSDAYAAEVRVIDDLIDAARSRDDQRLDQIGADIDAGVYGIGAAGRERRRSSPGARPRTRESRNLVQKVGQGLKKAGQAVAKAATAPQRLAVKGVLEVALPKAAPFFLYLFVNDAKLLGQLPEAARRKRKDAQNIADFIVGTIGMRREHFMGIVRTGIIKELGKDPEKVIQAQLQGKVSGIGVVTDIIKVVIDLVMKIAKAFGKKAPSVSKEAAPDPGDFNGLDPAAKGLLAKGVGEQAKGGSGSFDPGVEPTTKGWCKK